MTDNRPFEAWLVTGSQELYGEETLRHVAENSGKIAEYLDKTLSLPVKLKYKTVVTSPEAISMLCTEANANADCIGLITWMHTFSPAKMWIAGLKSLQKPFVHLHTQFNRDIPWDRIDMDFMNLNQSAHGDREFGFIVSRLNLERKVIVGHWQDESVIHQLGVWLRAAMAWHDSQHLKIARFGDNMREVAVTEGDKVEAQIKFGYSVYGYGVGDLVNHVNKVDARDVEAVFKVYQEKYKIAKAVLQDRNSALTEAVKIEIGMKNFLIEGGFKAFTTCFEDLHGLPQLPGLAVQHLMQMGYGFGAEGDWKTAALVRSLKVMSTGLDGGSSFMEDYTYHLEPGRNRVLGAHMLEVCPSIATGDLRLEVHPLSIGGKDDPARLVFHAKTGQAINVSVIDLGNRFRMILNEVEVVEIPDLPRLPVARVLWIPKPGLDVAAGAWILAGGAHHTAFSQALTAEYIEDFAGMTGVELVRIDEHTTIQDFRKELRWNASYYDRVR
jgi:L-arabinose isomerase